jgi:hypothetical protein
MPRINVAVLLAAMTLLPASVGAQALIENEAQALVGDDQPSPHQRGALITLAVASTSLQICDAYTTLTALSYGGAEANPAMRGVVQHASLFVALKGGVAAGSIYAATRLWRQHHRKGAIVLMAITNGTMAVVAAHNAARLGAMR